MEFEKGSQPPPSYAGYPPSDTASSPPPPSGPPPHHLQQPYTQTTSPSPAAGQHHVVSPGAYAASQQSVGIITPQSYGSPGTPLTTPASPQPVHYAPQQPPGVDMNQQHMHAQQQQYQAHPQPQYQQQPVPQQQQYQQQQPMPMAPMQQQAVAQEKATTSAVIPYLGYQPGTIDCPYCHKRSNTVTEFTSGNYTHLWALGLFLTTCCCCLPYLFNTFKDVRHRCANCGTIVANYSRG